MKPDSPVLPECRHQPARYEGPGRDEILALRSQFLNPGLFLYYKNPLMLVEGKMQYVWDETGRRYLDGIGGIVTVSVGHCHPRVTAAAARQSSLLQHSTTLYLQPQVALYAEKLASKLPGDLKVCYFVNSGSEANDLAMLMARTTTGNHDFIALRNAYHGGNFSAMALTAHSTWKFPANQAVGVHHAQAPYPYRGAFGRDDPSAGEKYAADVKSLIDHATCGQVAGFIAESIQGVGGFVEFPPGYLNRAYSHVRAAGGLCIADEVQTGFGRTGAHFWGFEAHGVIPDIVTMAKGIGNGFPLAAVVTTPAVAASMTKRIHFNTFGGNPVACATGLAVLEAIEEDGLQDNARRIGGTLKHGLARLMDRHSLIGEVRGRGLLLGIELVTDRTSKDPATAECARVLEAAREMGLLLGKGGLHGQTIRFAPPMCLTEADAQFVLEVLDAALASV